jgi:hypothetical protein
MAQLPKSGKPVLGMPGADYFPVLEFMDIDGLDAH